MALLLSRPVKYKPCAWAHKLCSACTHVVVFSGFCVRTDPQESMSGLTTWIAP